MKNIKSKSDTKKQKAKDKVLAVAPHMPEASIKKLAQGLAEVETIRLVQYDHVARSIGYGLVSGMNNSMFKEYTYRMNYFGKVLASLRDIDAESVKRALRRALARVGFRAPTKERDESDLAELERSKAAKAKALSRAKAEIKKAQPRISAEMLEVKAKEVLADKREAESATGKAATERAKVIVLLDKIGARIKAQELGNADPRPCLERLAAFKVSVNELA